METFARYLAAIDGTAEWSKVEPLFEEVFDPSCVFVTADGEMDVEQWAEMSRGLTERGAVASGFEVTDESDDEMYYRVTVTVGDDAPMHMTARATLRDGKIVRVEPVDPGLYSQMVERSRQ